MCAGGERRRHVAPLSDGRVQVTAVCSDVLLVSGSRSGQLVKWRCDTGSVVHYVSRDHQAGAC